MPPSPAPPDAPDSPEPTAPTSNRPERPPLGILHLMVLTACVAVVSGINTSGVVPNRREKLDADTGRLGVAVGAVYSIGGGAALAGLLLLTRRRRGLAFPEHPGEYLLVFTGVGSVLDMVVRAVFLQFFEPSMSGVYSLLSLAALGIIGVVFFWALACVDNPRWRFLLLAIPAAKGVTAFPVAFLLARWYRPGTMWRVTGVLPHLLVAAALMVVVLLDHFQGKRYPWTHWFGVATRLWLEAAAVMAFLWIAYR